jgi:succinyl-diaminopimelate desuccinylase
MIMNMPVEKQVSPEQTRLIESLKGLLSIPSIKGPAGKDAPFGDETSRALRYVLDLAHGMGFSTANLDGYAGTVEFGSGEKEIAMLCHLDVVPAGEGWKFDPFAPFIEDGRLFGRGTNDDKGPAMACLYAMKALKDKGYHPPCRIRLILGLDEESGSACMVHYKTCQTPPTLGFTPDAKFPVIFAEKGILHLTIQGNFSNPYPSCASAILVSAKGGERANMVPAACMISWMENLSNQSITKVEPSLLRKKQIEGAPGHASMPEAADNAISKAMAELKATLDAANTSHPFIDFYAGSIGLTTDGSLLGIHCRDQDSGKLTCNVGLLDLSDSVVSMTLDIRYPVTADVNAICEQIGEKCGAYGLQITWTNDVPPLFMDRNSDFIRTLLEVYDRVTGTKAKPIAIGGGTYARSMQNIVAFGPNFLPEDDCAHQAGEYMKLDDLFLCKEIYQEAIVALAAFATKEP